MMAGDESVVFFGLRTGVELFRDPRFPDALERVKVAALLYDRLVIEAGLLDVTVGVDGGTSMWHPPDALTPELRQRARTPVERGAPLQLAIGKQEARGVPATEMHVLLSTQVEKTYMPEFHTGILDELGPLDLDWVDPILTPGGDLPTSTPVGEAVWRQNSSDGFDKNLLTGVPTFERSLIYKSFNRDVAVAADMGASLAITPLFEPMVAQRQVPLESPGHRALQVLVPNVGRLTWEQVIAFREHPGAAEARAQLRELERQAGAEPGDHSAAAEAALAAAVATTLLKVAEDRSLKLGREAVSEVTKTGVAMIPGIGPLAEHLITAIQLGRQHRLERRSWTSALMKLQA